MNIQGLDFAKLGYVSIGVTISWDDTKKQKNVVFPKRWTSATSVNLEQYFDKHNNGIALLTGDKSDLIVVDCDVLKEKDVSSGMLNGVEVFQALIDKYGITDCPVAQSSSGGWHYFFSLSKSLEQGLQQTKNTSKITITKGLLDPQRDCKSITVDTRGDGGCIIVAPTNFSEREYKWIKPIVPTTDLPAMPEWCVRLINESLVHSPSGPKCRRDTGVNAVVKTTTTTLAFHDIQLFIKQTRSHIENLQQSEMSRTWERSKGYDYALEDKSKPCVCCLHVHTSNNYMVREVCDSCYWMRNYSSKCQKSGYVYNWESHPLLQMVLESPSTDAPYTKMLHQRYRKMGFELVCTLEERFLNFDGLVWEELPDNVVAREVEAICCPILDYLVKYIPPCPGDDDAVTAHKALVRRFAQGRNYLRKHSNVRSIVNYYKMMHMDVDIERNLDTNPDLLAVKNGIIDLRTGLLREGRRDDFCFKQLDTIYEEHGSTAMIDDLVNDLFNDDKEFVHYFQKLFGYAITGHTKEQCFAILTGEGANGKSLWISLIDALLEKWCVTASYDVFFKNERRVSAGGPSAHLMSLKGARICVKEETEPKDALNIEMLKMLAGESKITARTPYGKREETFMPTVLPVLLCNHKPAIDIEDPALTRRIVVIPFHNIYTSPTDSARPFDKHNPRHRLGNPDLRAKLLTVFAQEQLLTWLVKGAVNWYKEGLGARPQCVEDAWKLYKDENDRLKIFIDERCELLPNLQANDEKVFYVNAGDFLKALNDGSSVKYLQKDLIPLMAKRGFKYSNQRGISGRIYTGLRFIQ